MGCARMSPHRVRTWPGAHFRKRPNKASLHQANPLWHGAKTLRPHKCQIVLRWLSRLRLAIAIHYQTPNYGDTKFASHQ